MDRLELVRKEIDCILMHQPDEQIRRHGFIHLYGVSHNCALLAMKRGLDIELCAIIGLLHDIYTYKYSYVKNHAALGVEEAEDLLLKSEMFSVQEIQIVKNAIAYHSDKKNKHDKYCEMIKDADLLQNTLYNSMTEIKHPKRLKKLFKSLGVRMKLRRYMRKQD
jgi:uncharacterized protein